MATLCVMEYLFKRVLKGLLQKWVLPSLMIALGKPKQYRILLFKNSLQPYDHWFCME